MPPATTPRRPATLGLEIRVLGPLEVAVDGARLVVDTRKALAILALVAVDGRPFARDELAAMLWPESDDESARGALRRTLSVLRSAVGDRGLRVDRATVALDPGASWVDLRVVEAAVATGDRAALGAAASLARGGFLAGFSLRDSAEFDEWRATRATAVDRTVATLLDRLADALEAEGELQAAAAAATRRLALDPLDEAAHRRVMAILARAGDRAGAIRQYRSCVAALDRELGVAPLAETTALYEAILEGSVRAPESPAPAAPAGSTSVGRRETEPRAPADVPFRLPLVGRDRELARARALLEGPSPAGRVVAVTGEAGIGKSRVVEALADIAAASGGAVVAARAYSSEAGIAYGTVVGLLRAGLAPPDATDRLRRLPTAALEQLARLVDLPPGLVASRRAPADGSDDATGHSRLLTAIGDGLVALAGAGPHAGLLVVEDVHWVDPASLDALGWLARRLDALGPRLVLSWRPEDLDEAGMAFVRSLDAIPATEVPLSRLDLRAIDRLVAAAVAAGRVVPAPRALLDASEGLPLFVAEAILGSGDQAGGADGRMPGPAATADDAPARTVRALLRDRLAAVGEIAGQVLAAAAVLGRSFDLPAVRAVSGRSEDETVAALEELVRRGLVREAGVGPSSSGWDFAHARLREAAYESTSLARRRILHRRAAELIQSDPGIRTDPARMAQLAGHELAAGRAAEAAAAYADAGLGARALYANREAAADLEAAVALGHPDAARLQVMLGEIRTALGDYRGAVAALEAAAAVLPDADLPGIELRLGRAQFRRGDLASAAGHLDAALESMEDGSLTGGIGGGDGGALLARALVERAAVAERAGDPDAAERNATRALALAAARADDPVAAAAERVLGLVARGRGDLTAARGALERSLALASGDPDSGSAIAARNALALVLAAGGDRDGAIALLEAALAACRRTGERHLEAAVENNLSDQLHAAGRREDAMAHLKSAVTLFAEIGGTRDALEPEVWKLVTW